MNPAQRFAVTVAGLSGIGVAAVIAAAPAAAHVTVTAPGVAPGASDAQITFRIPDESDTASTTELRLQLPQDHPIAGVLATPTAGWTATITTTKLSTPIKTDDGEITDVVSEIDWKAAPGQGIKPGFAGVFTILAGKLPDGVDTLTFKAIQTYSDAKTVSWIELPAPGSTTEPEHPAPALSLAPGSPEAGASSTPTATATVTTSSGTTATRAASKAMANTGIALGIGGIVLAAVALGLIARQRRASH